MKKIASCILAAILAAPVLAEETSEVNYGQADAAAQNFNLVWKFERETNDGVTYAVITGVSVTNVTTAGYISGDISVPQSLVCSDNTPLIVKKIADRAFANQIGLLSINIPDSVISIGDEVFLGCDVLASITLPRELRTIGRHPFAGTAIEAITIPGTVSSIDGNILYGCNPSASLSVDNNSTYFAVSAGALYDKDHTKIIACPARTETLQLPITLTEIGTEAFAGCHRLLSLNVPASVAAIGARAFKDCTRLSSVSFEGDAPTADPSIVEGASAALVFYKKPESAGWDVPPWDSLDVRDEAAEQPSGIVSTMAGNVTWYYRVINGEAEIYRNGYAAIPPATTQTYTYNKLTFEWEPDGQLKIPSSLDGYPVTRIGDYAFSGCSALDVVSIPKSVRKIGSYAFANCTGITSLAIPSEVQTIGYHPFTGSAITSLVLPDSLRALDGNPLAGCDTALSVSISPDNSYYTVVNGLLYDKDIQTLVGCPARMESVSIPSSTTRIGAEAFDGCFRLRTILLPDYLTNVGASAFRDATRLSSLVFPASLGALEGPGMFEGCARLGFVGFTGNAPTFDPQLFAGAPAALIVYVAQGTTGWKDATTALPDSGKWPSDDGYGRAISNLDVSAEAELKEGDIFVGITTNGTTRYTYTLEVLANKGVKILGISPKPVGDFEVPSAFDSSLGTLTVKTLGDNLFANSIGLLSASIPNSVTAIGDEIFKDCNVLASVTLAHGLRSIGRHPFEGTAIETIALPDTVSSIDGNIFFGCDPSVSLSVGDNNPYFAESAEGALYDKDFTTLFAVPMTAEELTVPATATNIHDEAFANCIRLKAIAFLGNAPTAADDIFADTPATLKITVEEDSLGWDGDPASSALPASGLWRNRTITANAEPPIVDSNTDGTWKWTVNAGVATLYNGGSSALLDTNYNGAVSVPAEVTDSATGNKYTVVALGDRAMYGCKYVTAVTLPTTIESVGAEPFSGTKITTLSIPEYVADIGGNPAAGCSRFTGFTVDAANIDFSTDAAGMLYDAAGTTLLAVPARATEIYVPASVTAIADDAFAGCAVLAKVNFISNAPAAADDIYADTPATMTSYAQASASGFSGDNWKGRPLVIAEGPIGPTDHVTIGGLTWYYRVVDGVAEIWRDGKTAVSSDSPITAITLPATLGGYQVKGVGDGALSNLRGIESVNIPGSYEWIGDYAFSNCTVMASISIGYGVRHIGARVFMNTIVREIALPDSVIEMGGNISAGTLFTSSINIQDSSHFVYDVNGAIYNKDKTKLYACPTRAESVISLPDTVTNICQDAFFGCHRLARIYVPQSLATIGAGAFNVAGIWPGLSAPESDPHLVAVVFDGEIPDAADDIYNGTPADLVSYGKGNTWSGLVEWKGRLVSNDDPSPALLSETENGLTWYYRIVDGVAEIFRDGKTAVTAETPINAITLPNTLGGRHVKGVGAGALSSLRGITAISFPSTYEWIGDGALSNCTSLASVTFAHGLRSIGRHPFEGTAIETIALPDTVSSIDGNILYGCDPSVSLSVGDNNPYFAESSEGALYDKGFTILYAVPMTAEDLAVPATTTNINDDAFADCIRLASIAFAGNAPTAADDVFADTPATMTNYAKEGAGFTSGTWKGRPIVIIPGIDITNIIIPETNTVGDIDYEMFWTYELHTNSTPLTATLKKLENAVGDVTIKNIVFVNDKLYTVTNIAAGAIADNPALLSVTVPNTILEIGDEAFRNCTSLENVALAYGIRYIGARAFLNTIVRELTVPDSLLDMRGNISAGTLFTLTLNIDDSSHFVYSDDGALFNRDMTKLYACPTRAEGTIILPETLTNICADAFFGCHRLTYLNIPASVTTIGDGAFNVAGIWPGLSAPESTPHLESIFYNGTKPNAADDIYAGTPETLVSYALTDEGWTGGETWKNRKVMVISGKNPPVLSYIDSNRITWYYRIVNKEIEIYNEDKNHSPITAVSPRSTQGGLYNENDSTVYVHALRIPTSINGFAVTKIGPHAFDGCSALTLVGIPYSIREIGDFAFSNCTAIVSIDSVEEVPFGNYVVNTITLPTGVNKLGYHPFEGVQVSSVSLPYTLTSTDGNPAAGCGFVSTLSVDDTNPSFYSTGNILYDKTKKKVIAVPPNFGETSVSFLPSVTEICNEALLNCRNLTTIQLPESLTSIEQMALSGCSSVAALSIPSNVTAIGSAAFSGCSSLLSVTYAGNAPTAPDDLYSGTLEALTSYASSEAEGFTEPTWKDRPIDFVPPPPPRPLIYIDGAGVAWGYQIIEDDIAEIISVSSESAITALTFPSTIYALTVKGVGAGALASQRGITSISIPDTYEWIGDGAFSNCTSLATVTLGNSLRTIGRHPFNGTNIGAVSIPASVSSIDGNVLYGCGPAATVSVSSDSQHFSLSDDGALYDRSFTTLYAVPTATETLTVPSATTSIADDAFAGCVVLANVKFLGNAPAAADDIFADTPETLVISVLDGSLGWDGDPTSSALPASGLWRDRKIERAPGEATKYTDSTGTEWDVTIYDNKAELGANGVTPVIPASTSGEVTVPGEITIDGKTYTITSIPDGAFEGCSEITAINIPASITTIAADAFNGCTSLESFSVDAKNPAYSSRNGILYSKDGRTLVKVPAKTSFAATFTEKETAAKKEIVEVIGSTDPDTMTTEPNQIIELKSYGTSTSTTVTEFTPSISIDNILSGVTTISDYAFTDCGLMPEGSTVTGTLVVKVDEKETERKTGTFTLPVGTDSTGGHSYSYIYSQAGFYKGSVCLYHTASDSDKTISYAIPISIPTGISYSNLAFYNSHFTSKNTTVQAPPVVVVNPPVDEPDDDLDDTDDGFGVRPYLVDANGNLSAIEEGDVVEAHVGIKMSIPLSVGNAPDGSLSTVTAKGLPAGVKLVKTAVKEGRKVVKYIYAIEGTPSRAQSAKTVVLKVTNKKNKLNESVSFAIKVLAMPSWVGGKYNGVCFDGTTEIGSATATISAAGKLSGKIMVPSDDGKKALKLSYTAKGFSDFDEESNTFYGTATMRVNKQTIDVPFALSAYNGAGQLSLELPGMTAMLEQNTWKRGDIAANSTIKVEGFTFKLAASGKVKWSGSVEGDNGRTISVSGSTQLLSGPSVLVYIPPKSNLVGGRCELFQLQ